MNLHTDVVAPRESLFASAIVADERARRVQITVGADVVVIAEVAKGSSAARLCFRETVRRLPARDRARLVDDVFELSEVAPGTPLAAVLPVRECDILSHLLVHCADVHTHAAGVTCVVEATVTSAARQGL
jgi:hypothetical protein